MEKEYCPKMSQEPYAGAWGLCHEKNNQGILSNDYKACSCDYLEDNFHNCKLYKAWVTYCQSERD